MYWIFLDRLKSFQVPPTHPVSVLRRSWCSLIGRRSSTKIKFCCFELCGWFFGCTSEKCHPLTSEPQIWLYGTSFQSVEKRTVHLKRDFPRVSEAIIVRLVIIPAGFVLIDNVRENKLPGLLCSPFFR